MIKKIFTTASLVIVCLLCLFVVKAEAASTPTLSLTETGSNIRISVSGADRNSTVRFYFPGTVYDSSNTSYVSIDLGQTDSNGSYAVSVASNSYGLSSGIQVYVAINGAQSTKMIWPGGTQAQSNTSGTLQLSRQTMTLTTGLNGTVLAQNTGNTLTIQSNSNQSIASAYVQSDGSSVIITGLHAGVTTISICATSYGCASVEVTVKEPTQSVTFGQGHAYVVMGRSALRVNLYGPSDGFSVSSSNRNKLKATLDGTALVLEGSEVGEASVLVCASGWLCGSLGVSVLAPGSEVPSQVSTPAPISSDLSKAPQVTSYSVSSNNAGDTFFSANNLLNFSFGFNQTVRNVVFKVDGSAVSATQSSDGKFYAQYRLDGGEVVPLSVSITFENLSGLANKFIVSLGSISPTIANVANSQSSAYTFSRRLFMGMTKIGVSDADVVALQKRLTAEGVYSGPITGYFGPATKAAVEAYQNKNGLSSLGEVGPGTRALLNK